MPESTMPLDSGAEVALRVAETEAMRLAANHVGTEHVLLGVVSDVDGIAARVLHEFGIDLERIRTAIQVMASGRPVGGGWRGSRIVPGGEASPAESSTPAAADTPAWSPRANKAIALAQDEARRIEHSTLGTGHLLFGLIREGDNMATGILASYGVQRRVTADASAVPPPAAEWGAESRRLSADYLGAIHDRVLAVLSESSS